MKIFAVFKLKMLIILTLLFIPALGICFIAVHATSENNSYIKWIDFNVTYPALEYALKLDIDSHNKDEGNKYNWIEILAYISTKYGGNFSKYSKKDINEFIKKINSGKSVEEITENMKHYDYYFEAYSAILDQFVGYYEIEIPKEDGTKEFVKKYGLKVFSPIAKNFYYTAYDDFGNGRDYGYKRKHLGHDLMASVGTPVIAIESGTIEELRLESIWWLESWY